MIRRSVRARASASDCVGNGQCRRIVVRGDERVTDRDCTSRAVLLAYSYCTISTRQKNDWYTLHLHLLSICAQFMDASFFFPSEPFTGADLLPRRIDTRELLDLRSGSDFVRETPLISGLCSVLNLAPSTRPAFRFADWPLLPSPPRPSDDGRPSAALEDVNTKARPDIPDPEVER